MEVLCDCRIVDLPCGPANGCRYGYISRVFFFTGSTTVWDAPPGSSQRNDVA